MSAVACYVGNCSPVLQASDFTYLGGYSIAGSLYGGATAGNAMTHRYVGGQLRFIIAAFNSAPTPDTYDLFEFTLPGGGFGGAVTSSQKTNQWASASVWAFRAPPALTAHHYGIWWDATAGKLWLTFGVDYPGPSTPTVNIATATQTGTTVTITLSSGFTVSPGDSVTIAGVSVSGYNGTFTVVAGSSAANGWTTFTYTTTSGLSSGTGGTMTVTQHYEQLTLGVATCVLDATGSGTVTGFNGSYGFQGVSQRCVMGHVQPVPAWFQSQYSAGPYAYGFGGYASLMGQAGTLSLGFFALIGPDVTTAGYTAASYPPGGYAGDGSDWNVPSSAFLVAGDHRTGTSSTDWYTSPGSPTAKDRGVRLNAVTNYYDGGQSDSAGVGNATFTQSSTLVTFASAQSLGAGDWIGPGNGPGLTGIAGQVVASATVNSTSATLTAAFTRTTTTGSWNWFVDPPAAAQSSGQWLSPAPDGKNRWPWGESYFSSAVWIDGPNKKGIVCILSGAGGKAWYHKPGDFLGSDSGVAEIHVFSPYDLGAVIKGTLNPWNLQPAAMLDITATMQANGVSTGSHSSEAGCPCAASFDSTTNCLWIYSQGPNSNGNTARLDCWSVNA